LREGRYLEKSACRGAVFEAIFQIWKKQLKNKSVRLPSMQIGRIFVYKICVMGQNIR